MNDAGEGAVAKRRLGALALLACLAVSGTSARAANDDKIFVIGNYPIEARAGNAVAAKEKALADGQQAAFRALIKRLVPVTAYTRISKLHNVNVGELIEGISVRSERNSSTEYIASYDFSFQPEAVRRVLEQEGLPFVDRQAEQAVLIPVYRAPAGPGKAADGFSDARGSDAWLYAWKALDITNTLTPLALKPLAPATRPETIKAVQEGDPAATRALASEYKSPLVLLAVLEPDPAAKKIRVTLAGSDAVGSFRLGRNYRLDGDLTYTAELAALVSLGIIEGRWKVVNVHGTGGGGGLAAGAMGSSDTLRIAIEFANMSEWQAISRRLAQVPQVADLEVEGLSARGARVSLRYPGGPERLAAALASTGLNLRSNGGGWLLSAR